MRFDFFKISVLGDFSAAKAYLDIMERAIPEAERREAKALKERGESEGWEFEDYDCARQEQQSIFEYSVPRVLSYSFLTYVHGLVEVRLGDVARTLRKDRGLPMKHTDCAGSPIERAFIYLTKVADIRVGSDPGWECLRNLATLRHAIVHRGGNLGPDQLECKRLREIAQQLPPGLTASNNWDDESSSLEVSFGLCGYFAEEAHNFFERLLALTRPARGVEIHPGASLDL